MEIKNLLTPQARQSFETAKQGIKKKLKPVTDIGTDLVNQNIEAIQPAVSQVKEVATSMAKPIIEPMQQAQQRTQAIGEINSFFQERGINADDIKALAEEEGIDFNEVLTKFQNNGIKVEGIEELAKQAQEKAKEIPEGEDLGFFGGAKEFGIGAFRAGEQIPAIAGNVLDFTTQNITGPLIAGGAEMLGADEFAEKWREGAKRFGEGAKQVGEDITMAGMTNGGTNPLTQKQIDMRKMGGQLALTAPIGGQYLAGARGIPSIAGRTGLVGAGIGGVDPIVNEGGEATMGDIVSGATIGGITGAVGGPIISKVVAPAVVGIAQKGAKYGESLMKGGVEGLKKSVGRDISSIGDSAKRFITRDRPNKIIKGELGFTQGKNGESAKIERITGMDEADYLLNKGLAGKGKEELAEIFMKQSDDMYNGITQELGKIDTRVQSPIAKDALLDILEQLQDGGKLQRAYAKDIEGVKAMLARDDFSLSELNNIRRAYDKVNTGMFTAQGKARSNLESAIDVKVRQDLSNQLQKEASSLGVDVKKMNTELRAGIEMKDALLRRLSQEQRNDFIGLQDLGISAILSGGNPVSAIATIGAKKYAEKIAPGLAQKVYNLNKTPYVPRRVSRGNTITPRNKSSQLGLAGNTSDTVVSPRVNDISTIPGAKKTTVEVPRNPLGNESKTLAKKGGVMVEGKQEVKLLPSGDRLRKKELSSLSDDIATATKAARYGGTGNTRIESAIESAILQKKITRDEAKDMLMDILDDVNTGKSKYSYVDKKKLEEYIDEFFKGKKIEDFDEMIKGISKKNK